MTCSTNKKCMYLFVARVLVLKTIVLTNTQDMKLA